VLHSDDDGDGRGDRAVTVPMPIFHALGMLADIGDRYWVLPERAFGGNVISGFGSRDDRGVIRILLYAHHAQDTQARSEALFDVTLAIEGLDWDGPAHVEEYRIDRDHNSPFRLARELHYRPKTRGQANAGRLAEVTRAIEGGDPAAQLKALASLAKLDESTVQAALALVLKLATQTKDPNVREAAQGVLKSAFAPVAYSKAEVEEITKQTGFHPTAKSSHTRDAGGRLKLTARMASNGCNFVVIRRESK
jgi:hypothetical protein